MIALADRSGRTVAASAGRLAATEVARLLSHLAPSWRVVGDRLLRRFAFVDFAAAIEFARVIAVIADADDHHPDLAIGWGKVAVALSTHDVDGLSERDFIVAAKLDRAFAALEA